MTVIAASPETLLNIIVWWGFVVSSVINNESHVFLSLLYNSNQVLIVLFLINLVNCLVCSLAVEE